MDMKKKLVISTGAGMSAESGIKTFRDNGGMWEQYNVMDVASADGFARNPALVHDFYNIRRKELLRTKPNAGHYGLVDLEKYFDVRVITQNVDDLHERAGSSLVLHLHGELMKIRSMKDESRVYVLNEDNIETTVHTRDEYGDPVRPHIVFFQEAVPNIEIATEWVQDADIFVVIGTSMAVYPAAGLLNCVKQGAKVYYIDPSPAKVPEWVNVIKESACSGVELLKELLIGKLD